jgi:hypothetical protein
MRDILSYNIKNIYLSIEFIYLNSIKSLNLYTFSNPYALSKVKILVSDVPKKNWGSQCKRV